MGHLQPHRMFSIRFYTIHGETVQGKRFIILAVYALLPNKKQDTYSRLFEVLQLKTCEITMDFEIAARNAIKQHNPAVDSSYCYFHFCQSLLRKVQIQGKKPRYGTVSDEYRKESEWLPHRRSSNQSTAWKVLSAYAKTLMTHMLMNFSIPSKKNILVWPALSDLGDDRSGSKLENQPTF